MTAPSSPSESPGPYEPEAQGHAHIQLRPQFYVCVQNAPVLLPQDGHLRPTNLAVVVDEPLWV